MQFYTYFCDGTFYPAAAGPLSSMSDDARGPGGGANAAGRREPKGRRSRPRSRRDVVGGVSARRRGSPRRRPLSAPR